MIRSGRRAALAFALALAAALAAAPARAAYQSLEEIPVESPVYGLVQELATSHGFGTAFLHTLPWDRADLGRFLDQLALDAPEAVNDPAYVRLRRELGPAAGPGGWEPWMEADDERSSLEVSPYLRANYAEDRARSVVVRDFRGGVQGSLALGPSVLVWADLYAGTSSPGPHGNPVGGTHFGLVEGQDLHTYFDRGTVTFRGRLGRLEVGHTWLRWGPGTWGTMALSDGAPAFDVVEARVPLFHRAQFEWFVAALDPTVPSYLAGHRLELRPSERWDVSFAELARFDGAANVPLYLLPMVPYSLVERRVLASGPQPPDSVNALGKNNVMWAVDAAWRMRPDLRVYGELAIDDFSFSSEQRPRELAWQLGFDTRRDGPFGPWTLRGEYSRVYRFTYSSYSHHDFAHAGDPTGFPLGPDVDRLGASLACRPSPDWSVGIEGAYTRKGESGLGDYYVPGSGHVNNLILTGVLDLDSRAALRADWSPAPGITVGGTAGWASVTALAHVRGDDRTGVYGETRCTLRW